MHYVFYIFINIYYILIHKMCLCNLYITCFLIIFNSPLRLFSVACILMGVRLPSSTWSTCYSPSLGSHQLSTAPQPGMSACEQVLLLAGMLIGLVLWRS